MSRIKPGMMCITHNCNQPENNGKVVEIVKWCPPNTYTSSPKFIPFRFGGWLCVGNSFLIRDVSTLVEELVDSAVFHEYKLIPISDPDIDVDVSIQKNVDTIFDKEKENV